MINDMVTFCHEQPQAKENIKMYAGAGKKDKEYVNEVFLFAVRNKLIQRTMVSGISMYQSPQSWL